MSNQPDRIQKVLARAGVGSRRACDELVKSGRVTVNGSVAEVGQLVDPFVDKIVAGGKRIGREQRITYLLHKPRGIVTSMRDEKGREGINGFVPSSPRVFPVGRLDMDSSGLLIMTNDGELAQILSHPRHKVEKVYVAHCRGTVGDHELQMLAKGVDIGLRRRARASVKVLKRTEGNVTLEFVLGQGMNRQVRRMCEAVGLRVKRLTRTRIGSLELKGIPEGAYKILSGREVAKLKRA